MVATPSAVAEVRIAEYEAHRHRRLLERARAARLMFDHDYASRDGMIVWSPAVRGRCEVVTVEACSCREFRLWGKCPHHALYLELTACAGEAHRRP